MPIRIQRKRTKGWVKPFGAINCTRPSKFSNPFKVILEKQKNGGGYYVTTKGGLPKKVAKYHGPYMANGAALLGAIDCFKIVCLSSVGFVGDIKRELKGKDLMCYCPLHRPCHVDVLLKIANE